MELKNILVFRIGHLGDTLVALPAFWAIRRAHPDARMTLLTNIDKKNPHYLSPRDVLPHRGLFDDWLTYPTNLSKLESLTAIVRLVGEIRSRAFDAVIYLTPRERSPKQIARDRLFFRAAGVRRVIGIDYIKRNRLGSLASGPHGVVVSEGRFLLDCLSECGIPLPDQPISELLLDAGEKSIARLWLANETEGKVGNHKKLLAVAPGGKRSSRLWPESRFEVVVGRLVDRFGVFPIVFGGPEDRPVGERLIGRWGTGAVAAGDLNVRESAALLTECEMYLGNDTGTMHLAAAVGIPCVAIYSAADWHGQWHPLGADHTLLRKSIECEGCHLDVCPFSNKCLELVGVDEVFEACATRLGGAASRSGRMSPRLSDCVPG